jgi:hypothetical protein
MTNPSQWAAKRGTMPTTYSERKDGIATMFAEASEADLELYLDKIDKRIATCETRGEIDVLNRLYWKIRFVLEGKRAGKD